jgi:hypothetical protein
MASQPGVVIGLNAVVVAVTEEEPRVLLVRRFPHSPPRALEGLPYGPFDPARHRTLESGLRSWVEELTRLPLGYVEQLYTFGDRGRDSGEHRGGPRVVSVGYLALVREARSTRLGEAVWRDWYRYLPWEDRRPRRPPLLDEAIEPLLRRWIVEAGAPGERRRRAERVDITFGFSTAWNEELVLDRYELLYEAGVVEEAVRDDAAVASRPTMPALGQALALDHRRILATAMGRLRGKIKYRPVVFELMPPAFTLLRLQRTVEALAGIRLHKQNFRRLVVAGGLVEPTGRLESRTGGRPAEQFRFRTEVLIERPAPGVKLPAASKAR